MTGSMAVMAGTHSLIMDAGTDTLNGGNIDNSPLNVSGVEKSANSSDLAQGVSSATAITASGDADCPVCHTLAYVA